MFPFVLGIPKETLHALFASKAVQIVSGGQPTANQLEHKESVGIPAMHVFLEQLGQLRNAQNNRADIMENPRLKRLLY